MPSDAPPNSSLLRVEARGPSLRYKDILVLSPTPTAPTDQGNRKRIYAVCREFKNRGARIHFVYYPHEWWFNLAPMDLAREMAGQWDSFHLLPSTRPLHTKAEKEDHTIDEWWDPAIGDYLKWLFARGYYDAFIVNYTYLSKAFEFAPPHTLKILDTHDKFTGRRELLESHGLPREFFYTTQDQEAVALNRAELVWAIKDEEAEFFRGIANTPCITMPHLEPVRRVQRVRKPEDEDYLVVGMLGARNAINVQNARAFVRDVLPHFRRSLAPIKVRLAGGMCGGLGDLAGIPGVDIMGRVESVDEFYAAVDVVTIPLVFSTGLKIKAVEAFASGMPVVAHRHALEGIPVEHPFHLCNSMEDIAKACIKLSFDCMLMHDMAGVTRATYHKVQHQAKRAFDQTAARINKRNTCVVTLGKAFFDPDSVYREHAIQTIHYLRHLYSVVLYFDEPLPPVQASLLELLNGLGTLAKVALSPDVAALQPRSLGLMSFTATLSEILEEEQSTTWLWLLRIPEELTSLDEHLARKVEIYVRLDALRLYQPNTLRELGKSLRLFKRVSMVESGWSGRSDVPVDGLPHAVPLLVVPFWRWKPWQLDAVSRSPRFAILAQSHQLHMANAISEVIAEDKGTDQRPVVMVADATTQLIEDGNKGAGPQPQQVATTMGAFRQIGPLPRFALDLSPMASEFEPYRETLRRLDIPVITAAELAGQASGSASLWSVIDRLLDNDSSGEGTTLSTGTKQDALYENDAGWTQLWKRASINNVNKVLFGRTSG